MTQEQIDNLAKDYARGRIPDWMLIETCDDDMLLFQKIVVRSQDFPSVDDGEAIDGLM